MPPFKKLTLTHFREYEIEYLGLKIGQHTWHFEVAEAFFAGFEYSEIKKGLLKVEVLLDKQERMLMFDFNIKGHVCLPCDRCMEDLEIQLNDTQRLIFKFGESYMEESDEVIIIPEKKNSINLASFIYEFIVLMIPMRKVHPDSPNGVSLCNPDALNKLHNENSGNISDPRWDKLKDLLN